MHSWVNEKIKREIKNYLEANKNEDTILRTLWNGAKAVLRVKFIGINTNIKKLEGSQINNLTLYLKELENEKLNLKLAEGRK